MEATHLASLIGIFVKNHIPIFPSWRQHVNTPHHFKKLLDFLQVNVSLGHSIYNTTLLYPMPMSLQGGSMLYNMPTLVSIYLIEKS
jgi:hypothetical protein